MRYIQTKREKIKIPDGLQGTPIEDVFDNVPETLVGALIYEIDGQKYIANQLDDSL